MPQVLSVSDEEIVLAGVAVGSPSPDAAREFGRRLAVTHRAGSDRFGASWTGFVGDLPMPNDDGPSWSAWYAEHRVRAFLDEAGLSAPDRDAVLAVLERLPSLPGADEPPARLHGDLWSGNVLWSVTGEVVVIDPAAHGGHRETDLAMLALFGVPHRAEILAGYQQEWPLTPGWEQRIPVHQLFPLLVHCCLFGGGYREQAGAAARAALGE